MTKTHIQLKKEDCPQRAIVCGDPERARIIASYLTGSKLLAQNREYHSYKTTHAGREILVTSHGVGSAGAAICFNELIDAGVKKIIRVGTAGALYDGAKFGDIVVPTGAIRKDGVSHQMVPAEYPALPSLKMCLRLIDGASQKGIPIKSGIILTSDLFYPGLLDPGFEFYKRANAIAVEMECSTLFVIGLLRNIETAAILAIDGSPLKWAEGEYDPTAKELKAALESAAKLAIEVISKD